jgi:hypothetical protein
MLCQWHMPSAAPMVCRLYHTFIHSNASRLYDSLVVQSCYTNVTCHLPVPLCAGCILLSYTPMPAGCTIMIYQWHMPSAGPVVCRLYTTVIHSNTSVPGVWCGWKWAMDRHLATPMPINDSDVYNAIIHSCTTRESYTRPALECMTV